MTTTKPIAEQVAEVKVGDFVEARFAAGSDEVSYTGKLKVDDLGRMSVCEYFSQPVTFRDGRINQYLTSITRVPRPIPSEPEVGYGAKIDNPQNGLTFAERLSDKEYGWCIGNSLAFSWAWLYPHITRLYTPSGDLVTGFEYYVLQRGRELRWT